MARLSPGQTADRRQRPAVCPSHKIQLSKNIILLRPGFGRLGMDAGRLARAHSVLATALLHCRVLLLLQIRAFRADLARGTAERRSPSRRKLLILQNRPAQAVRSF